MPSGAVSASCRSRRPSSGSPSSHPTWATPSRPTACGVVDHPLMVLAGDAPYPGRPTGVEVGIVDADDDLAALSAVAEVGFAAPGTATGTLGAADAVAAAASAEPGHDRVPAGPHAGRPHRRRGGPRRGRPRCRGLAPAARRCERDRRGRDPTGLPSARARGRRDRRVGRRRPRARRRDRVPVGRRRRRGPGVREGRIPAGRHRLRGFRRRRADAPPQSDGAVLGPIGSGTLGRGRPTSGGPGSRRGPST